MNDLDRLLEMDPARTDTALGDARAAAWMAFCKGLAVMGNADAGEHKHAFQSWWLSYGVVDARGTLAAARERDEPSPTKSTDTRVVALAKMRCGSGLHAAPGSMADDLGRLAAAVVVQDLDIKELWAVVKAARDHALVACPGQPLCIDQHSINCPLTKSSERLARAIDHCPHTQTIEAMAMMRGPDARFIDVVFDGPPSHESGRFVEVEDEQGRSISIGTWIDRGDGLWALRIEAP